MRALTLVSAWVRKPPRSEALAKEKADLCPRDTLYEDVVNTDVLDGAFADRATGFRRHLYRVLPVSVAQVLEAYFIRRRYRVVISWTDFGALLFALLLKVTGQRFPHVAMMFWISRPKKAVLLKHVHSHIDTIILWTSAHRDFAIRILGIPPAKLIYVPHYVDQKFWRPMPAETNTISSAGREMRDYPTLLEAMRQIPDIRCHIATGEFRGMLETTVRVIYDRGPIPPNVTVGKLSPVELRALYARSRFVVVPLLPTDSDNGLNVILEAFAMGKPVICSRTERQRDVIQEGKTGIFVPQGDSHALAEAIQSLWHDPARAEAMGRAGREYIERHHTLDAFVQEVRRISDGISHR